MFNIDLTLHNSATLVAYIRMFKDFRGFLVALGMSQSFNPCNGCFYTEVCSLMSAFCRLLALPSDCNSFNITVECKLSFCTTSSGIVLWTVEVHVLEKYI